MIRLRSLRNKLLAVIALVMLPAVLVSIGTIVVYDLHMYEQTITDDMTTQAELLGHMSAPALSFDDRRLAFENLALLRLRPQVNAGAIYDAKGRLFARYAAYNELAGVPAAAGPEGFRIEHGKLQLFKRIEDNGELLGTVYLRANYEVLARFLDYVLIGFVAGLLALFCAWLVSRRLNDVITRPILSIAHVAREVMATGDMAHRAPRLGQDEVADLADTFNRMLAEIEVRKRELESSNREIARESEQRHEAQHEVMRLNEELERRVHERTMQLETANRELGLAMEEAKSANQAKSAFLSSMSHELRTPLNAILGFAQILTSDRLPSTLVQKKEFANHILKSGRHLLTLINEILDLAKIESGAVALSMEPVALPEVLQECDAMMAPLAAGRGIRLLFPQRCAFNVQADRTRLKQILLNLLSNAIKYNREGGAVVIDCSVPAPGLQRVTVQDTGMGLKPEQVRMLFQPFNRLGQEAGAEEGSGIGLVVTKRLVELMGGTIGVSSSPGVGSMFWIELASTEPVPAPRAPAALPPAAGSAAPRDSITLLYVEDNPANLKLVQEIIRYRPGLRLLSAPDGQLGLEMARAHLPDLILLDINLPGMNGFEVLRQLRAEPATAHIPVIALTANAMPRDVERGIAAGFFRYLIKPINIDEFTAAVNGTTARLRSDAPAPAAAASPTGERRPAQTAPLPPDRKEER
ncbi:signal transduction histidine kinase [Pseudoduganella lurida]|uniref:histidine kinase n=1 Tax=Pseudoduganella lurida TaxID=1036180 RepID=A0A562RAQ6_9BURK|nr:ATP-binding protein [Pseudoduganella lurida]TWI66157.1 signal transduction histidine kinase [Pseudoduganella lurida]